ncbi:hypothetical protein [Pseudomonas aeruginosa]|uniref:hypothetical protein n=1 Tax=Pseudomonas aeruginosa TaxID=287 RepID=UPI000EB60EA3|nr:hypothetical protein [Pseudomonas aeruginosa]
MHLRVTTESDTYVYATSPLRLAGLDPEDFIILALPVAVLNTVNVNPVICLLVGCFCLWLYKNMTAGQPSGFLSIAVSLGVGRLLNNPVVQQIKPARAVLQWTAVKINHIWITSGLLPLPSYCNLYER